MAKRWRIHSHDPDRISTLKRVTGVPDVVAELLICRGISDPGEVKSFLDPKLTDLRQPDLLPGCLDAARIIHESVREKKRIVVYGDYDVDGMTGTAILWLCLKLLGANTGYYVPHRIDDGYGLSCDAIRSQANQGTDLIVTTDCGIGSVEEAALARELGIQLIITDHHEASPELPDAEAIVHPRLPGSSYPFGGLSGSGVALKLAWALCQQAEGASRVGPRMRDFLLQAVGLAAMGTIADVVPLVDENRVLVRHGLNSLAQQPTLGISTLMRLTDLDKKHQLDAEDIGFTIAPRLNAAGRLQQAGLGVELLTTDNEARAAELAEYLNELNANRQTLERSIQLAANKQAKEKFDPESDAALVLADRGWHPGVIGIVAGRLAERYHRPVVLIGFDQAGLKPGAGSARSIPGFNLHQALAACDEYLVSHGGHAAAAGLKIDEQQLDGFRDTFCEIADAEITDEQRVAELRIDTETVLSACTLNAVRQIERLAPFGQHNERPMLCTSGVSLVESPKTIGGGGRHLSVRLTQHGVTLRGVAFGAGHWAEELDAHGGPIDVAFRPIINTFRGRQSVELHIADWKPSA